MTLLFLQRPLSYTLQGHVNCTVVVTAVVGCAVPHDRKGCDCVAHGRGVWIGAQMCTEKVISLSHKLKAHVKCIHILYYIYHESCFGLCCGHKIRKGVVSGREVWTGVEMCKSHNKGLH